MTPVQGRSAIVTGGTDGIGAATALELRARGADVVIVGRSADKAEALVRRAAELPGPGSLRAVPADLSSMATAERVAERLARELTSVDLVLSAVGVLITRTAYTSEGLELDFAVGYLARFVLLERLAARHALHPESRLINVAASAPQVPRLAQLQFTDLGVVERRTGMTAHGQTQLANDLLTAQAADRYGVTAIGYGPGAVDTNIRREVPAAVRALLRPLFARTTRTAAEVGAQLADIFEQELEPGVHFFDRRGSFPTADFVTDRRRQQDLLRVSLALTVTGALPRPPRTRRPSRDS